MYHLFLGDGPLQLCSIFGTRQRLLSNSREQRRYLCDSKGTEMARTERDTRFSVRVHNR